MRRLRHSRGCSTGRLAALALLVLVLGAGCYSPRIQAGSPCSATAPCPSPLVCDPQSSTCESSGSSIDAGKTDARQRDARANIDAPMAPPNDLPQNPIVLTQTTTVTESITYAHDDAQGDGTQSCGGSGGRDVFFEIPNSGGSQTWYFDTFGSTYETIIRVSPGACTGGTQPNGTTCDTDACATTQSQLAINVSGTTCVVVDENPASSGSGSPTPATLVLHVESSGRKDGIALNVGATTVGNTCTNADALWTGSCGGAGDEDAYYFTVCPNKTKKLTASTCNAGTGMNYPTVLYVRQTATQELACAAGAGMATCPNEPLSSELGNVSVTGAHLFWLVVDSVNAGGAHVCGGYTLTDSLQ